MTRKNELIVRAFVLAGALAFGGCNQDTAIALTSGGSGGSDAHAPDITEAFCPPGPAAPLGESCTVADQRCAYGYNSLACGGRTVICKDQRWIEESHSDPMTSCFDAGAEGPEAGVDGSPDHGDTSVSCCPRDSVMAGCLHLGGANTSANSCDLSCDFFCSINWRVEKDAYGCDVWRWDRRAPQPGENQECFAVPDGGSDR